MRLRDTLIDDAVGEAFAMPAARLIVTAGDRHWLDAAVHAATGYATSIIGCDCEAGLERRLNPSDTPDQRPGVALLFFARSATRLRQAVRNRAGQAILTCPTTALYDGLPDAAERFTLGRWLGPFGDGYQHPATHAGRRGVSIPVMSGTFFAEAHAGQVDAVAGGTLILAGQNDAPLLDAAQRAIHAIADLPNVITPFPAGLCRAGSKVGANQKSKIKNQKSPPATTNDPYCPTLRDHPGVATRLPPGVNHAYEIVINALTLDALTAAMHHALHAAAGPGADWITTGSYGGKLGDIRLPLRQIAQSP